MSEAILDAFRHNAWANRVLIDACRELRPEQLDASAMGGYGNVLETLKHLLISESYYTSMFTGSLASWHVQTDVTPSIEELAEWAADAESTWEKILSEAIDGDGLLTFSRGDGITLELRAGVLLAQVLHHGNVHREQVSAALTASGIEPPDVSGWGYGRATGRYRRV